LTARNQQQQLHRAEVGIVGGLAEVESGQLYCPRSQAFASSGQGAVTQFDGTRSATAAPQGSGRNSEGIERSEDSGDNKESKDNKDSKDSASKNKSRSCRSRSWCRHPGLVGAAARILRATKAAKMSMVEADYGDCDDWEATMAARATGGWVSSVASDSNNQRREAECGLPRHPVLQGPRARRTRGNDAG
jgi:hypothetical protein